MGGSTGRAGIAQGASAPVGRHAELLRRLSEKIGSKAVLAGDDVGERYRGDATDEPGERPVIVFRPANTTEVSAILAECNRLRQPLVIQGGRTGLAGGARPRPGEVSISLERMVGLSPVDENSATIIAEAGVTLQAVQDAAAARGLFFGVDIGARGTSTVGGNVATNAGGIRVLRYGMYRSQVLGLEAVLADGSILTSLKGLPKDNSGFDLNQLFIGTEGVLGVVTRACLRLHPEPRSQANAFCALPSLSAAVALLKHLRSALGPSLSAFEVIFPNVYDGILSLSGAQPPVAAGAGMYALVEMQGQHESDDNVRFSEALMACYESGIVTDVSLSQSQREYHAIWKLREAASEFIFSMDNVSGFDVSLPLTSMQAFIDVASREITALDRDAEIYVFGHLGDGNLHFLVRSHHHAHVADITLSAVIRADGAISAEHGIGVEKKKWLPLGRSEAEMEAMRRLKAAFDPNTILNPGRVFDMVSPSVSECA
ncbi:FAD-binding oxidoreductase [Agrobacterium larrymoorei]|uniref:FAD/FMN-containing dehydrogenase n=1 Tax=Agrobacterium larrymoorei TaxID=160699 RepID=A0ABU0UDA1_9HYPH|nr:FAD-binding oxidoreductase [Agrobacterium larrymoorei]MDQ1182921.1 FAD/FMN-containing dehydrogenase [Agrobacterium larrymoorei]